MDPTHARSIFELITAGAAAIGAVYGGWRYAWPLMKRWGARWMLFWTGFDTVPLIHGSLAELHAGIARLEKFGIDEAAQGASRGAQIEEQGKQISAIGKSLALTNMTMRATLASDPNMATFEADPQGRLIEASKTMLRWTGKQFAEVAGWGWIATVHPDDRLRVRNEWNQAVSDCRTFELTYLMCGPEGAYEVRVTATPIPELVTPCEKYIGVIYRTAED